jgi:hypothetical protein
MPAAFRDVPWTPRSRGTSRPREGMIQVGGRHDQPVRAEHQTSPNRQIRRQVSTGLVGSRRTCPAHVRCPARSRRACTRPPACPPPVMVSSRSRAWANGTITRSTCASSSAIDRSSCSRCSKARRTSSTWWAPSRPRRAWRSWGAWPEAAPWPARPAPSGRARWRPGPPTRAARGAQHLSRRPSRA